MRKGFNSEFIVNGEDGKLIGLNLGADAAAEHEWGIAGIKRCFNILTSINETFDSWYMEDVFGMDRRKIADPVRYFEFGSFLHHGNNHYYITNYDMYKTHEKKVSWLRSRIKHVRRDEELLHCEWNENNFLAIASQENEAYLQQISDAMKDKDLAIYVGAGGVFRNGGLKIVILSNFPEKIKKEMYEADMERYRLLNEAKATKIDEVLRKAGKQYLVLTPRWDSSDDTKLIFWLNPMQQNIHNFGWFTLEDLRDWSKGKGKIMKENKQP